MKTKTWKKPELVVLTRTKPEEAVLTVCKGGGSIVSPAENFNGCGLAGCDYRCDSYTGS